MMDLFGADKLYPSIKVIPLEGPKPSIRFFIIELFPLMSLKCAWKLGDS